MTNKESMIKKYGSEEAYIAHLKQIASRGGSKVVVKGWNARNKKIAAGLPVPPRKAVDK